MRGIEGSVVSVGVQGRAQVLVLDRRRVYTRPYFMRCEEGDLDGDCELCCRTIPPGAKSWECRDCPDKRDEIWCDACFVEISERRRGKDKHGFGFGEIIPLVECRTQQCLEMDEVTKSALKTGHIEVKRRTYTSRQEHKTCMHASYIVRTHAITQHTSSHPCAQDGYDKIPGDKEFVHWSGHSRGLVQLGSARFTTEATLRARLLRLGANMVSHALQELCEMPLPRFIGGGRGGDWFLDNERIEFEDQVTKELCDKWLFQGLVCPDVSLLSAFRYFPKPAVQRLHCAAHRDKGLLSIVLNPDGLEVNVNGRWVRADLGRTHLFL
jgi:hypothetical protein